MPLIIGLGTNQPDWKDPLGLYGGDTTGPDPVSSPETTAAPSGIKLSDADRSDLVNTIIAEAAGEGPEGMAAVASVIKNRSQVRGKSPGDIVREPDQFTGYFAPGPDAKRAQQDPKMRAQAEMILNQVLSGKVPDPTGGADHYHATSVSPYWADAMPKTADIGNHRFYKSDRAGRTKSAPSQVGLGGITDPFQAVLKGDTSTGKPVNGAETAHTHEDKAPGAGGRLAFVHEGQDRLDPTFRGILEETSAEFGRPFTINSGYRGPDHPVEAAKEHPGQHSTGSASDISMKGMDEGERKQLVQSLLAKGVKRFGIYKNSPDMLHVDMKDQTGNGSPWFMYDRTNRKIKSAPAWFQEIASNPTPATAAIEKQTRSRGKGNAIVIDENFTPANGLNVYGGQENPFEQLVAQKREDVALENAERADQFEQNRIRALTEQHNREVGALASDLEADNPGRYQEIDESELSNWQQQWEEENRSGGLIGDTGRILKSGAIGVGQSLSSLADTVFSKIPGGDEFLKASDDIDRWLMGNTLDQKMENTQEQTRASVTERQQEADAKNWWDSENKWFGPAWRDPRSYLRVVGESAPATVVTMAPGGILARGAYLRAIAGGASQRAAAAAAARTATLSGAIAEGTMGGADSARNIRDRIGELPREQLLEAEAVQDLIAGGMSEDEAVKAVTEDAATMAFLVSGVATGMFGGLGDRTLAKIIAEGVGGGVARRILAGGLRGAVGEGILEEAPQGAAQTIAENLAMQNVDPDQELTEGVGEAVASGIAGGGVMGGGMGAAGGAARRAPANANAPAADENVEFVRPPEPRGPVARSVRHAEEEISRREPAPPVVDPNDQLTTIDPTSRPAVGATVRIDADGIEPFMGRIDGYEGDEAVVIDSGSGEIYQVPTANITQIAKSPEEMERENPTDRGVVPIDDEIPALSNDPALEPADPIAGEVTTEPLPPRNEQKSALERFPTAPGPGSRVIVDNDSVGRFPGTIQTWTEDKEAVVKDDSGNEYQVPASDLYINKLTEKQVEAQDLKRNPPVERERPEMTGTRRKVGKATVELPDEDHAALYDLAVDRLIARRSGESALDLDRVSINEVARLAKKFKVATQDLTSLADDYRYRTERAGKQSNSDLPVKMHELNDKLLRQRQRDFAKTQEVEPEAAAATNVLADWWDLDLDDAARRKILADAGVKRSEKMKWGSFTPAIRSKIEAIRDASGSGVQQVDVSADQVDPGVISDAAEALSVDAPAHDAATSPTNDMPEPTQAQKEAGNYKLGHMRVAGLDLSIENPEGSERKGVDGSGKPWSVKMKSHYGYIRGTVGRDKDHIDVFVKPGTTDIDDAAPVFVVDQRNASGRFDEHKSMVGFDTVDEAREAYLENYTKGWKGLGDITPTTMGDFKRWLQSGNTDQPFAPKWFGSRDKAEAHVAKQGLGATHEVVENGKRFEVREKIAAAQPEQSVEPTNNIQDRSTGDETAQSAAEKPKALKQAKPKLEVSANTVFTDDAAEKARALLRKKLSGNTLNSGIDPEILQAGITLAGYHIEKGARTFAAYAAAMVADLGDDVRPFLKSWYMGVKYDPRAAAFDGMSSAAEVEAADINAITGESDEPAELDRAGSPALEGASSDAVPGAESSGDAGSSAGRGSRADVSRSGSAGTERVQSGRGVADDARDVSPASGRGQRSGSADLFDNPRGNEGGGSRTENNAREVGPFGPILRGYEGNWRDAALELERRRDGDAIGALSHPDVGPIDLVWGNAGTNRHNGAGLAKMLAWHPEALADLQGLIDRLHVDQELSTPRRIQLRDATGRAGVRLDYDGVAKTWLLTAFESGSRRSKPSQLTLEKVWAGDLAGGSASPGTAPTKPLDARWGQRTGTDNISDQLKDVHSAATPVQQRPVDFTITDADQIGEGGQKTKFNGNVRAIKLLRTLDDEKRSATRDEQSVLAQWVGWGGLRQAFYREDGSVAQGWEKQAAELKSLLTPEEYSAAESSTRNAHYTAPQIVSAVWDIARRFGFRGGQVLEPSVGAGNFLGLMPGDVRDGARVTGVELDRITGSIAKHLYPSANIQAPMGFEKLTVPNDHFDLAIGNPPFGSEKVYDKDRRHLNKLSIHNFFFAKSMEAVRPGGVLAMVVTNRFLDGSNVAARQLIAKQADLVGAIRLPNNAFLKNAGTEVTTDIVLLRKRMPGEAPGQMSGTLVDPAGKPLTLYHGTQATFDTFNGEGLIWVTPDRDLADDYSEMNGIGGRPPGKPVILELNMRIQRPFDIDDRVPGEVITTRDLIDSAIRQAEAQGRVITPEMREEITALTRPYGKQQEKISLWQPAINKGGTLDGGRTFKQLLTTLGFDGVIYREESSRNGKPVLTYAALDPSQVTRAVENQSHDWTAVGEWKGRDGKSVPLNRYFIDNPQMMLGDFGAFGSMYGPDEPALVAREGQNMADELDKAIRSLPQDIMVEPGTVATETVTVPETVADVQVGAMFAAPDGTVHERLPDSLGRTQAKAVEFANDKAKTRVAGMIRVRDAFARLRRAQIDESATDAKIENLRKRLNVVYDAHVKAHGPINADANKRLFRDDPTWPQIAALEENFDKGISAAVAKGTGEKARAPSAAKAPIFTKRTQQPYRRPTSAASAKDALATVLNDYGRVDLEAMSRLYGKPPAAIVDELGSLLYKMPSGAYETADAYLSGNVKQKLAEAERAAADDPDFRRNVNALRDVIPADIDPVDIDVKPGSPWVPAKHVEDFIKKIAETDQAKAFYSPANARWVIDNPTVSAAAQTMWGTDRATVGSVLSAVLNGQSLTIYDRHPDGSSTVNQAATDAANEKAERVKAEWRRWIWEDDARRDELARLYNDTFNTDVQRVYDGSHLTLPGKVGDDIITLRPHQKNFIWRTLQSGTALADHTVGAGKTFAAIASIMEKRRTGQARKPILAVPNHLVGQWAADFIKLYPGAKVLAATKRDFEKNRRKQLFARVATGDWDVVIVAHSSFGKIGMDPEYEAGFIAKQMEDLEASIAELRAATGAKSRNVSQLTKWRDNLKAKMERLLDAGKKDDGLTFDELGVDALYVDEFHEFKNLPFATGMQRVAGLGNPAGSQKATDLYMKMQFVLEKTGGNNVVTLTGTPLSNTMAEMYTVQRYLDGGTLSDLGVAHFDAWAKVFGEVVTDWELSPSGQYKLNSRFAKFVNMPELMQRYLAFADVITNDDIKAQLAAIGKTLPLPKVRGGKPTNIAVERSPDQAAYIGEGTSDEAGNLVFPEGSLVYRAENLPRKAEKGADNMLKVMSDARKAALDMRLIDPSYPDHPGSKVNRAADEMQRLYDQWAGKNGTQLVFIDLSTPKKAKAREEAALRDLIRKADEGDEAAQEKLDNMSPDDFLALQSSFSVYDDLREKLISRGVPADEIAFIHDANTEGQKEELFGKVRSGRIRFLFGSTPKMGAGTNVQNRLVALHHLDAPWRPSDLEQRDGRGIRQGNELYAEDPDGFEIEILRYATKNTLDARQWQGIEAKARFIQQVRKGNLKTREIEDIAGEAANAAEMKAEASGNPLILDEMETRRKLRQLESQSVEHDREQHRIKGKIRSLTQEIEQLEAKAPAAAADAATADALVGKEFAAAFGGATFDKPKDFGAALIAALRKELIDRTGELPTGKYGDFGISAVHNFERNFDIVIEGDAQHYVNVNDAADVDPTGLAMRVTNTVKKLAGVPAANQERITEAGKQIPALEKQIGEWANAAELEETTARHRRIIEALKPKKPGATPVTVISDEADAPIENKQPDPVVTNVDGKLRSLPVPSRPEGQRIHDWARNHLFEIGNRTGHEYLIAVDDDGSVVEYGTAGQPDYTGMNSKLAAALENPDRKIVAFHNHPRNTALSTEDISILSRPGLHAVWAIGNAGRETRAALTPEAMEKTAARRSDGMTTVFYSELKRARDAVRSWLTMQEHSGRIDPADAAVAYENLATQLATRAGIVDFTDNSPYDPSLISGLDRQIDDAALKLARTFFNDNTAALRPKGLHRPTQSLRHVAELEGLGEEGQRVAGTRSGPTGLSEGSAPNNPRKDSGRKVTESRIIGEIKGKLTDLTPAVLKTIPLNYFTDLARPNMKAVGEYLRVKRAMDAFRGEKHADADAIAGDWLKYTRLGYMGKDKSKAEQLAALMHDSTLAGVDPSSVDEEVKKKPEYENLRRRWHDLSSKGKELYLKVRDAYADQQEELDQIILDNVGKAQQIALNRADERYKRELERIRDSKLDAVQRRRAEEDAASAHKAETTKSRWAAKARMTKLRIAFENSRVEEPYFPLGRFGRYFVTVRDVDGAVLSFSKFEKAAERDRFARDMERGAAGKVEVGVMEQGSDLRRAMDPRIVAEIESILGDAGVQGEIMDQIWQRYLESMPDLSSRKRFIHRKGTHGFSGDALRVFSSHMFHSAHQMARLKYGLELQELVDQTFDQAKEADDPTAGMTLANEMSKRHDWVMNPTGSKVAQTMTSAAFVWFLASSPAAAAVNMTQTVMMGLPILAGRFGSMTKAAAALGQASLDSVMGRGSVAKASLSKDERQAMDAFYKSGLVDRTQSHDLAGVGDTGVNYSPLRARIMAVISWAFHRAEVWNREVTALAAYRMARDAGANVSQAIDEAHDITWKTHFDYSNSSRPSVMQNDFAKVALVFRNHNINMLYRLGRDVHQSLKGESKQAKREARYQLAGVLGMQALMAGVSGVAGFNLAMAVLGMIFGDEDDPIEFGERFKADMVDVLGPELGGVVLNGVPGHYLGIDLTNRIGMPDLWFRSPNRELQGRQEYQYWLSQSLGATVALGESLFVGAMAVKDGEVARGIEMAAPKAVRDIMKSFRYGSEGLTTFRGDTMMTPDQVGWHGVVAQAIGFTPARVSETWDRSTSLKNAERRILDERQRLVNKWGMAAMDGDEDGMKEAVTAIQKFNASDRSRGVPIKKETLQRSIRTRARNAAKREDGVLIQNRILSQRLREALSERIYE